MRIVISFYLLGLMLLFSTEDTYSISRYNSTSLTCAQAKQIINTEGAVIIRYPAKYTPGLTLHDRFVKNARQCQLDEYTARKSIPTADTNSCRLRHCKIRDVEGRIRPRGLGFN